MDEFITELTMFTIEGSRSMHDDLIDALSYGYQIAEKPMDASDYRRNNLTLQRNYVNVNSDKNYTIRDKRRTIPIEKFI